MCWTTKQSNIVSLTLIRPGGGHISPPVFQKIIAPEPNVGLTSHQAVNSSFYIVPSFKTRASRTTGARGINFLASSNKYQIASIIQKRSARKYKIQD